MDSSIVYCIKCHQDVGPYVDMEISHRTYSLSQLNLSKEALNEINTAMGVPELLGLLAGLTLLSYILFVKIVIFLPTSKIY